MTRSPSSTRDPRRPRPVDRARTLLLAALIALSSCGHAPRDDGASSSSPDAARGAEALLRAGETDAAREAFRARRLADPDDRDAWLGEIALARDAAAARALAGELDARLADADDAVRAAELLALRALIDVHLPEAETRLRAALQDAPDSALVPAVLARRLEARGDHADAAAFWRQAGRRPDTPEFALLPLARAESAAGDVEAAIAALERLVERRPDDAHVHYDLGTLLLERGREPRRALAALERALALAPDDRDVALNTAAAALLSGDGRRALAVLEEAVRRHPEDPLPHFQLGVLHADHLKDPAAAIAHFERYLELGGEHTLRVGTWLDELRKKARTR